ncbi:hypothetical protein AX17_003799 [Amanita inopinata Kibby_2008]|nr:hypothetical protein AX17_003799 [Amanita inopinata Kibby_2008]
MAKKQSRRLKHPPQLRSRQTRSSKGRALLSDPAESTQALTEQLAALGLYAVPTIGDGNCLFRALSDQYYGSDSKHHQVRRDICDWIATHKARYAPFVDDERGIDTHLSCMHENATYGGHMELSAFSHLTRRNIKVIQPGLVYVIEWNAGGDPSEYLQQECDDQQSHHDEHAADARDRRKQRRDRMKNKLTTPLEQTEDTDDANRSTMYVAYHDWEHFSSIRNLSGPHVGIPLIQEAFAPSSPEEIPPPAPSKLAEKNNIKRVKLRLGPPSASSSTPASVASSYASSSTKPTSVPISAASSSKKLSPSPPQATDPTTVPLPGSRTPSPSPPVSALSSLTPSPAPYPETYAQLDVQMILRTTRSPKRNFDEGTEEGEEYTSEAGAKRPRVALPAEVEGKGRGEMLVTRSRTKEVREKRTEDQEMEVDVSGSEDGDAEDEEGTVGKKGTVTTVHASASIASEVSSISSLSSASSTSSSPSPPPPSFNKQTRVSEEVKEMQRQNMKKGVIKEGPLTRRQKRALALAVEKKGRKSAGVIVIPGGRSRTAGDATASADKAGVVKEESGEWLKNGSGRVDVRGFRELRI